MLERVAAALKVSPEVIKSFSEAAAINYFNTFHDQSAHGAVFAVNSTVHPLDKWMETVEENKKLYKRLFAEKDEHIRRLELLLGGKQ